MFKPMLSVLGGLFVAFVVVLFFETILPYLFHVKPINPENKDQMELFLMTVPQGLLIANALTYGVAALMGSYATVLISGNSRRGFITTLLFFIVVLVNFFSFKHPAWMISLGCAGTLLGGYLGTLLKRDAI
jgi:hypothetical protein